MSGLAEFMERQDAIKSEHGTVGQVDPTNQESIERRIREAGLDVDEVTEVAHEMASNAGAVIVANPTAETIYHVLKGMWIDGLVVGRSFDSEVQP